MSNANEAGPTPGPWHVGVDKIGTLLIVSGDGDNFDGGPWVYDSDKPEQRPMRQADADLIAAAPDLLAACEDLTAWWRMLPKDTRLPDHDLALGAIRLARSAIAKAKGAS